MSTHVSVNTYTHSVTYVTGQMLGSLKKIILWSGLSPDRLLNDWTVLETGVSYRLQTKTLTALTLEIFHPKTDALVGRWDFEVNYTYGAGDDGEMWVDTDAIKFAIAKAGTVPSSCSYDILVSRTKGASILPGWSPKAFRSTEGFSKLSAGTTVGASSLGSNASYWRKP